MLSFLPNRYISYLNQIEYSTLYEIRLRAGFKVKLRVCHDNIYLGDIVCSQKDIDEIIKNVTERSLYAFNESLKKGFLTTKNGIRIGVAGECVYDNGNIVTIKNISSLNIRIPHCIDGCSDKIYPHILNGQLYNSLVVSPPFYGKTTILKDIIKKLNNENNLSILLVDERSEFCSICGENIDNIKYCNKEYAFSYAIRSMSPNVIITDELSEKKDWEAVKNAVNSGVKVIASCHGNSLEQIRKKDFFLCGVFERYIVLDSENGQAGIVKEIYDGDCKLI